MTWKITSTELSAESVGKFGRLVSMLLIPAKSARQATCHLDCRSQATFLKALRHNPNVTAACAKARVNRTTAYRHREDNESFAARWDEALDASVDAVEEKAFRIANEGDPRMIEFVLKAFRPERYRQTSRVDVGLLGGIILMPEKELKDP